MNESCLLYFYACTELGFCSTSCLQESYGLSILQHHPTNVHKGNQKQILCENQQLNLENEALREKICDQKGNLTEFELDLLLKNKELKKLCLIFCAFSLCFQFFCQQYLSPEFLL
jgi:regulator of replication initiation timing